MQEHPKQFGRSAAPPCARRLAALAAMCGTVHARGARRAARAARRHERALSLAYGKMLYKVKLLLQKVLAAAFTRWALRQEVIVQLRGWRVYIRHCRAQRLRSLVRTALRGWAKLARRVTFSSSVAPAAPERRARGVKRRLTPHPDVDVLWALPGALTSCSFCDQPLAAAKGFAVATCLGRVERRPWQAAGELWCPACRQQAAAGRVMLAPPAA